MVPKRFSSRAWWALLLAAAAFSAQAQPGWLTMVGNSVDPNTSTIDVYVASLASSDNLRSLDIRVNRNKQSVSSEGIPFRSYTATILVNCAEKTARFATAAFYMMPIWEGKPHKIISWSAAEVRPVLFRNFDPNPIEKIIRAACPKPAL